MLRINQIFILKRKNGLGLSGYTAPHLQGRIVKDGQAEVTQGRRISEHNEKPDGKKVRRGLKEEREKKERRRRRRERERAREREREKGGEGRDAVRRGLKEERKRWDRGYNNIT